MFGFEGEHVEDFGGLVHDLFLGHRSMEVEQCLASVDKVVDGWLCCCYFRLKRILNWLVFGEDAIVDDSVLNLEALAVGC